MSRRSAPAGDVRAKMVSYRGRDMYQTEGYFTIYDRAYPMWDFFGEYDEIVTAGAGTESIAAKPDTIYLVNHTGLAMARTGGPWNQNRGTLELSEDSTGGSHIGYHNPERDDVQLMMHGIDDGQITEMSFAFMITDGWWSDDFMTFEIRGYDINRGDVSAVNFGANPFTSISARAAEILADLDQLPPGAIREALRRLESRIGQVTTLMREVDPATVQRVADAMSQREQASARQPSAEERAEADAWVAAALRGDDPPEQTQADQVAAGPEPDEARDEPKVIDAPTPTGRSIASVEALLKTYS